MIQIFYNFVVSTWECFTNTTTHARVKEKEHQIFFNCNINFVLFYYLILLQTTKGTLLFSFSIERCNNKQ